MHISDPCFCRIPFNPHGTEPASIKKKGGRNTSRAPPPTLHSPARGSSGSEAAEALCAATAKRPDYRATHADRAADCIAAGTADARWWASKHGSHVAALVLNRPPTSTPTTPKRQRRARTSSGYAAPTRAWPGRASAPGTSPARVIGLAMVASMACWEPCQSGSLLATTSMRRSSETGTSMLMSARRTLRATRAPASWQTPATARSWWFFVSRPWPLRFQAVTLIFAPSPARSRCQCPTQRHARIHHAAHGMRWASGGKSVELAKTSPMAGASPSTLLVPARGRPTSLDVNARAAAKDRMADQRRAKAEKHAAREGAGAAQARHRASRRTKVAASVLHLPPISMPSTVKVAVPGMDKLRVSSLFGLARYLYSATSFARGPIFWFISKIFPAGPLPSSKISAIVKPWEKLKALKSLRFLFARSLPPQRFSARFISFWLSVRLLVKI